jgi:carbon-monoxide dehydrogenase small subunit
MKRPVRLQVNGNEVEGMVRPNDTLLDLLRDELGLTGAKQGCGEGDCGACTVLLDGSPVSSCLVLALQAEGSEVLTVEGLADKDRLHPIQQAFVEIGGVQCGFCTPGMLLTAKSLLDRNPDPDEREIRAAIAGNLCRCTGYQKIVEAISAAAAELRCRRERS